MKLEVGTFTITKDDVKIVLTAIEAKELYAQLNEHFGLVLSPVDSIFNNAQSTFQFSGSKTTKGVE